MDVRCERCSTEYEFDDALVSGRGTTVKCTNCGHKFRIRRSDGDFSEDFWNVQTGDGRTLVFTSLRELQRAIQTNLVDRNDLLSRGGLKQKPIGQIPELAPFFEQRDAAATQRKSLSPSAARAAGARETRDITDAGATASASQARTSRPPPPPGAPAAALGPPRQRMSTRPDFPPAPAPVDPSEPAPAVSSVSNRTLIGTGGELGGGGFDFTAPRSGPPAAVPSAQPSAPPPAEARSAPPPAPAPAEARAEQHGPSTERDIEPETERFEAERHASPHAEDGGSSSAAPPAAAKPDLTRTQPLPPPVFVPKPTPAPPRPAFEASSPLPPPTPPVVRSMNLDDEPYERGRRRSPSLPDGSLSDAPPSMGRRRSVGGFIVAFVVVGGIALIGVVWAKDHLGTLLGGTRPPAAAATDPRASALLAAGEKALGEGNLDLAKESFDKASALAEKDPRVLLGVARLAAVRADMPWLKSRLLPPGAADEHRLTRDDLAELSAAARKAADDALAVAPDDPAALRAKIDALRISGDQAGARALVGRVASPPSQPESAYVLATLDLAESEPLWSTVIERLRVAASAETGPGRGRACLAYALARSGDVAGARAEVERLAAMPRQHVLLPHLRAFADRGRVGVADAGALDAGPKAADGGKLPTEQGERHDRPEHNEKGDKGRLPSDARQLVAQGEAARSRGDYDRAQTLFGAALDRNANDTEALNGLAAIAHARHDLNGARASYKRVLSINPSYVPALVGVGDVDWESGDRASAMKTYKEIVERFPEGTYPTRIKQRIDAASAPAASPPSTAPTTPVPAPSDTGGGG